MTDYGKFFVGKNPTKYISLHIYDHCTHRYILSYPSTYFLLEMYPISTDIRIDVMPRMAYIAQGFGPDSRIPHTKRASDNKLVAIK